MIISAKHAARIQEQDEKWSEMVAAALVEHFMEKIRSHLINGRGPDDQGGFNTHTNSFPEQVGKMVVSCLESHGYNAEVTHSAVVGADIWTISWAKHMDDRMTGGGGNDRSQSEIPETQDSQSE